MRKRFIAAALGGLLLAGMAYAQSGSHTHASHGGQVQKIGKYEAELVLKGSELTLYLNDENDKPADAARFSAVAAVLAKGNQQKSVELKPGGENKMVGKMDFPIDDKLRATVTLSSGSTELGKGRYSLDAAKR